MDGRVIHDLKPGVNEQREGAIALLVMHNPGKRNATSPAIREGLIEALDRLMRDESCRAIVVAGSENCFSSGGDITSFKERPPMPARRDLMDAHRFVKLMITGEKPVIAAVEGYAYGAGMGIALCCDMVVAARNAEFCASFARIGLMPDMGLLWTLPQRVGAGAAKELIMLAKAVKGEDALALGIADELAEPGQAIDQAFALAHRFAAMAPAALGMVKVNMARFPMPLDEQLAYEAQCQGLLFATEDMREGIKAFFEKRPAKFEGR